MMLTMMQAMSFTTKRRRLLRARERSAPSGTVLFLMTLIPLAMGSAYRTHKKLIRLGESYGDGRAFKIINNDDKPKYIDIKFTRSRLSGQGLGALLPGTYFSMAWKTPKSKYVMMKMGYRNHCDILDNSMKKAEFTCSEVKIFPGVSYFKPLKVDTEEKYNVNVTFCCEEKDKNLLDTCFHEISGTKVILPISGTKVILPMYTDSYSEYKKGKYSELVREMLKNTVHTELPVVAVQPTHLVNLKRRVDGSGPSGWVYEHQEIVNVHQDKPVEIQQAVKISSETKDLIITLPEDRTDRGLFRKSHGYAAYTLVGTKRGSDGTDEPVDVKFTIITTGNSPKWKINAQSLPLGTLVKFKFVKGKKGEKTKIDGLRVIRETPLTWSPTGASRRLLKAEESFGKHP